MFGFPPILDGNAGVKLTNDADSGFPKPGIREVFYSIKDGNWSDNTIWQTASGRVGIYPTSNDDVYIRHNITVDPYQMFLIGKSVVVNNFTVIPSGRINGGPSSGFAMTVAGDFKCYGNFAFTGTDPIGFLGVNNYIDKSRQETKLNGGYYRNGDQPIMDALYNRLLIQANVNGLKYTTSDLTVDTVTYVGSAGNGALYIRNPHSFTCNGTFNVYYFYSDTEQNLTFKGSVNSLYMFFCTANPTIEFQSTTNLAQGNYAATRFILPFPYGNQQSMYLGTGLVKFTTNNISFYCGSSNFDCDFLIDNNIVVTNIAGSNIGLTKPINGSNASSELINSGGIYFNTFASVDSMTTGIFDYTTNANTIGFTGNYSATIPSYFTTFRNLLIAGTGTKTLGVNTTINGGLQVFSIGTFDLGVFNIDVIGQTTIAQQGVAGTATLNKTGAGNVLFRGLLLLSNSASPKLNFSGGNPTVELRGGIQYGNGADPINSGTGQWTFTTNNQDILQISLLGDTMTFNCPILISGPITVTNKTTGIAPSIVALNNVVNGDDVNSKFVNNHTIYLINASYPTPMTTGVFDITTNANTLVYAFTGNYTIPYTAFSNLHIITTGTKTLSNNTNLSGNLFISNSGVLEVSTYDLTVTGSTTTTISGSLLSKNSSTGGLLFIGVLYANINFTGNPAVELRGGVTYGNNTFNTGTGQWSFTTNNQSLTNAVTNPYTPTFSCSILISGITLTTINDTFPQTIIITGVLNGVDGASVFRMGTGFTPTVNYQNTTQPMDTGVLDTSTNLNTWIYGNSNQDVKGNPTSGQFQQYRNLTLNGGGTKTLQGNINVQNTYTLTAPATLALNGFIKTP